MAFDQSAILEVVAIMERRDLRITWTTTAPADTWFQIYLNRVLAWAGTETTAKVPVPSDGGAVRIDVGTVLDGEEHTDFSASLTTLPGTGRYVTLQWEGGTYLDPADGDVAGFNVYRSTTAGGAVDYGTPVGHVVAYPQGVIQDGFGEGGFGEGAFGE